MKLRDLIYSAFRISQVTAQGEYTTDVNSEEEAVLALQGLVANWSANQILLPFTITETFDLVPGKGSYTIGEGSDFDTQPPEHINAMYVKTNGGIDYPVTEISQETYFSITKKDISISLSPTQVYYQYGFPIAILYFWPIPSSNVKFTMATYKNFNWITVTTMDMEIPLPSPYLDALKYNLAVALCIEYATSIPPAVAALAQQTLQNITKFTQKTIPYTMYDIGSSPYNRWRRSSGWY